MWIVIKEYWMVGDEYGGKLNIYTTYNGFNVRNMVQGGLDASFARQVVQEHNELIRLRDLATMVGTGRT